MYMPGPAVVSEVWPGRIFTGANLKEIAFPLGGIGTGTVSLTGSGALREWQIKNRPDQLSLNPRTFFALWTRAGEGDPVARVLEGPLLPPYHKHQYGVHGKFFPGSGLGNSGVPGLPRLKQVTFRGQYPFANIDMADEALPLSVSLEAYNPFIPMNPDDSGIPCAVFNWTLQNTSDEPVDVSLAMSMESLVEPTNEGGARNRAFEEGGLSGIEMDNPLRADDDPKNGSVCIVTPWESTIGCAAWPRLGWFDALQHWWDRFSADGTFPESAQSPGPEVRDWGDTCSLGLRAALQPGASVTLPVWVTWSFPTFEKYWGECEGECSRPTWRNYYAQDFPTARRTAEYLHDELPRLYRETSAYRDCLHSSTLPAAVLDAVSSQISILRSPTCLRLPDGTFYGFEGCNCESGCCVGSCTHVWNYTQALPFLFPGLQRSMREAYYEYGFSNTGSGAIHFRLALPLEHPDPDEEPRVARPAADGQLGGIIQVYRDWKVTGDTEWLKGIWPSVVKSLEFAWKCWDYNKRGVPDGLQHNTYDIEFYGPNSLVAIMYLGALQAGSRMARAVGEDERAEQYAQLYEQGRRWVDENLFNGEYYEQHVDFDAWKHAEHETEKPEAVVPGMEPGEPRYQYGRGCLSDQLLGQTNAHVAGLGHLLDPEHVRSAMSSIFQYNFREDLWDHACCQRVYALQDEAALLLCSWPRGGRPALPFPYSDESWTGIEYQVAVNLIYEGLVEEGLRIVEAARERYDGRRRNPWNEYECGSYYARAMSCYGLLLGLSGFQYDGTRAMLGFAPCINEEDFCTFWSAQQGWGTYHRDEGGRSLDVAYGRIRLKTLGADLPDGPCRATLNGEPVDVSIEDGAAVLPAALELKPGDSLEIRVGG